MYTYASLPGVYVLVLEKPVLMSFPIYRKIQDLCRSAGVLQYFKSSDTSATSYPLVRESSSAFSTTLLKSNTDRIINDLLPVNLRLAISMQWGKEVYDPCHFVEQIPFCDTQVLSHIVKLLRFQQRFNSLILNTCQENQTNATNLLCLPVNIMVDSLVSFTIKTKHPQEQKFLKASIVFDHYKINEPTIRMDFPNSEAFEEDVEDVFHHTWSLANVSAFIWQRFLPEAQQERLLKQEMTRDSMMISPEAKRVSLLEEILAESEQPNDQVNKVSPNSRQKFLNSNSWLPNSSNVTSFEPSNQQLSSFSFTSKVQNGSQRGRPKKNGMPSNAAIKSPGSGNIKKRPSLPPQGENDLTSPLFGPKPKPKRVRKVSTSPSTSSPAFSMQPSPMYQSNSMTPAFNFPSEHGEESVESASLPQPSPCSEKIPESANFPSPMTVQNDHPARPGSEEDEKGLVICEPGGSEAVFAESPGNRPGSSMSDHLRLPLSSRGGRVLLSSDESEQSSSNSLPEDKPASKPGEFPPKKPNFPKLNTVKVLELHEMGSAPVGPDRNQQARAALDRVLMKNRVPEDDAYNFEKDSVQNTQIDASKKAVKRPAPTSSLLNQPTTKLTKSSGGASIAGTQSTANGRQKPTGDDLKAKSLSKKPKGLFYLPVNDCLFDVQ